MTDWFWNTFLPNNLKIEALKNVQDGQNFTDKNSVERKLINSLCYDFAKQFPAEFLVQKSAKKRLFSMLWNQMSNLHPFEQLIVPHKNRQVSLKTACFDIFTSNVTNFLRIRGQKERKST